MNGTLVLAGATGAVPGALVAAAYFDGAVAVGHSSARPHAG